MDAAAAAAEVSEGGIATPPADTVGDVGGEAKEEVEEEEGG